MLHSGASTDEQRLLFLGLDFIHLIFSLEPSFGLCSHLAGGGVDAQRSHNNLACEPQFASFSGTRSFTVPHKEENEYIKGM